MKAALQIDLNYDQILALVKQLTIQQKIKLTEELGNEVVAQKLTRLLKTFRTDELDLAVVNEEVESVRQQMHDEKNH